MGEAELFASLVSHMAYTRFLPIYLIETGVIDKDQFIESLFRLAKSFDADEEEEVKQGLLNIAQRIADTYSGKSEPRWRPEVIIPSIRMCMKD